MSAQGDTVLVWVRGGKVEASFRTPAQGWSEPQIVGGLEARAPFLDVASDGTAIAAWWAGSFPDGRIEAAVRPPGGVFGAPQVLASQPGLGPFLAAAAGRGGRGAVLWAGACSLSDSDPRRNAQVSLVQPDWTFGAAEPIPNSMCANSGVEVAMDDTGGTIVLIEGSLWRGVIKASTRPSGGVFSRANAISRGNSSYIAEFGVTGDGTAIAAWVHSGVGVEASLRPPDGEFTRPRIISRGVIDALTVTRNGTAMAFGQSSSSSLESVYLRSPGWFGRPERVTPPLSRTELANPAASLSPGGRGIAAWGHPGGQGDYGVFVASRGPNCRGIEATITGTPGDDTLRGTARRDVIVTGRGDDTIEALAGNDLICAGAGHDVVRGGIGNDSIYSGAGPDLVRGGAGDDSLFGGDGEDNLAGRRGNDDIFGGRGQDVLRGNQGVDRCDGGWPRLDLIGNADLVDWVSCEVIRSARSVRLTSAGAGPD